MSETMSAAEIHLLVTEGIGKIIELAAKHDLCVSAKMIDTLRKGSLSLIAVEMARPNGVDIEELKVDVMVELGKARKNLQAMLSKMAESKKLRAAAKFALGGRLEKAGKHAARADPAVVREMLRKEKNGR